MKLFIITLSCAILAVSAVTYVPSAPRLRRDVSELLVGGESNSAYLPPHNEELGLEGISQVPIQQIIYANEDEPKEEVSQPEIAESEVQDTAVFGENGYEYKTVVRRDVSHLKLNYLPPLEVPQPSNEYLPPVSNNINEEQLPSREYLPPAQPKEKEVEIANEPPKPSNEYLPPANVKESEEVSTELPEPSKQYLPPAKLQEAQPSTKTQENISTETEPEPVAEVTTIAPEDETTGEVVEAATESIPEDTAIFAEDGYRYKKPSEVPAELFSIEPEPSVHSGGSSEYLLPLEEDLTEALGPNSGESAAFAEDGYHYRIIKRRF